MYMYMYMYHPVMSIVVVCIIRLEGLNFCSPLQLPFIEKIYIHVIEHQLPHTCSRENLIELFPNPSEENFMVSNFVHMLW